MQYVRLCDCGCGTPTDIASKTTRKRGAVKGQPLRYRQGHGCRRKVDYLVNEETGCWEWQGKLTPSGYARAWDGDAQRNVPAHRVEWEKVNGPIPPGLVMDHLCRVRHCVNPEHLEPVTNRENIARGNSTPARVWRTGKCIRGHDYTPENTRYAPNGQMVCRQCQRIWDAAKIQRRRQRKQLSTTR